MKKLLLFVYLFAGASSTVMPQSLTLSNSNGPIPPNAVIIQPGTPDSNTLLTYINVHNTTAGPIEVLCKKTELTMLDSTHTYMCWANYCYAPHVYISPDPVTIGAGETYTGFKGIYAQLVYNNFTIGESRVRWTFFDKQNENDSASVTVLYQTFPVGIGTTGPAGNTCQGMFPNPANGKARFDYALPAGSSGELLIQNIHGAVVQTRSLPAWTRSAWIDLTDLPVGLYFYSLRTDGIRTPVKKLVVSR